MAKDINIHIKAPGAEETKQQLDQVGEGAQKLGQKVSQGAKTGSGGMDQLGESAKKTGSVFGTLKESIGTWLSKLAVVATIIKAITLAIQIQKQAIEEHARIVAEQQKELLNLQYVGEFYKEHPAARKEVAAYAEAGRRPFGEVAKAYYALETTGGALTEQQKRDIMKEALELGRQLPGTELKPIIELFSTYVRETQEKDINIVQNVIKQTLTQARVSPLEVAQYFPEFLPTAIAGGLTGPQAAGLWAYTTGKMKEPRKATSALQNIFMALEGKGTPESQELLKRLGVTSQMDFFEKLGRLSTAEQAGKFGLVEAESLASGESAVLLLSMLRTPQAMMRTMGAVTSVARPDIDLVKRQLEEHLGTDTIARLEEDVRQIEIAIENAKGADVRVLKWRKVIKEYELAERQAGTSEYMIAFRKGVLEQMSGLGVSPDIAWKYLTPINPQARERLKETGTLIEGDQETPPEGKQETPPAKRAASPIITNNYNYNYRHDTIFNPIVGNRADLIGPRVPKNIKRLKIATYKTCLQISERMP
jgi:hypothetical protein